MHLSGKRIFLFGFIAVLLIGIPVTVYLVQRQQQTQSHAAKSTNLAFSPDSSASAPIQKNVGDPIPLDISVDPGTNLVSIVKFEIVYDPTKLATASANAFQQDDNEKNAFPALVEAPIYTPGKITVTLSVGPDPTKAIQTKVKAATVTFTALANTPAGTPTLVSYGINTQVSSAGPNDQAAENVLSSATPATIVIGGAAVSPTASIPTVTPTPTEVVTPTPTQVPTATPTPSATNQVPVCSSLTVDNSTGNAPLTVNFTANGSDSDGTVSKVTFNFGDGQVSDVTTGGGIGTASASAQTAHTYNSGGTFTASAVLTDNSNGVSDSSSCKQTITVTGASVTTAPTSTPAPTIAPTGSTETTIGIGAAVLTFVLGGGFLFFFL